MKMGIISAPKVRQNWKEITKAILHFDVEACPRCKDGKMIRTHTFQANGPPWIMPVELTINKWTAKK